jgi:hypothetical protein
MHYWRDQDKLFVAYNSSIAVITASTGALITTLTPFGTTNGTVGFSEFQYADGTVKLVAADGVTIITIDTTNTVVAGTSPDQPAAFEPNIIYLDGYVFLVKSGTADIYNSNLDDPLLFTAGDFITAEMLPDTLVRIARLNNYILALGSGSIEYFFNAANASGSPLQRNETFVKQVGFLGGIAAKENTIYFVGYAQRNAPQVYRLEDAKIEEVDNPPLRRFTNQYNSFNAVTVSYGGKDFYILNVGDLTYQMDIDTKLWTRIAYQATSIFPANFAVNIRRSSNKHTSVVVLNGSGTMVYFDANTYRDSGVNFSHIGQTESQTFETLHEKTMSRLLVYADRPVSTSSMQIQWTDDDYQTFSTARSVSLNTEKPKLDRLGRFVRRAFKYTYTDNYPLRIKYFEVDLNIGTR